MLLLVVTLLKTWQLSLLFLFAGIGKSGMTGAAEGEKTTSSAQPTESLQDLVNNSISPFYIKKEIIEREDEEGNGMDTEDTERPQMVGVFLPSFEQPEPGTLSEGKGRHDQFDIFAETSGERTPAANRVIREVQVPRIDHRYHVVRGLGAKDRKGIDLNKEGIVPVTSQEGFAVKGDDRFALHSNSFKVDKGRNISRSFDATSMLCTTCPTGSHDANTGRDGLPVVLSFVGSALLSVSACNR
jgi:hypothetical protein